MTDNDQQFAYGGSEFAIELFEKLKASAGTENILISPFFLQACMGLAFAGAKEETASEIANGMKYKSNSSSKVANNFQKVLEQYEECDILKIANKIYVQEGHQIKTDYASVIRKHYHADAESVNFSDKETVTQDINIWIEEMTDGLFSNIITTESLRSDSRLVLLNAVHFKGRWEKKFNESVTEEGDFWINRNECVRVDYMLQCDEFGFASFDEYMCSALEMPYENSDLSLFVVLPKERDGLRKLAKATKNVNLVEMGKKMLYRSVRVTFPKFKIDYSLEMTNVLKKMGITKAFSESADFSKILDDSEGYNISNLLHKTCIEINEEGTDSVDACGIGRPYHMPPEFKADHPFFYWVWNKKNILLAGAFVNVPGYSHTVSQTKSNCPIL